MYFFSFAVNVYSVPTMLGLVLNTRAPVMSKSRRSPCTHGAHCLGGEAGVSGMNIRRRVHLHTGGSALWEKNPALSMCNKGSWTSLRVGGFLRKDPKSEWGWLVGRLGCGQWSVFAWGPERSLGEGGVTRQEARGPAATLGAGSPSGFPAAPEQSPGPLHGLHHPGPQRLLPRSASYVSPPTWLFSAAGLHQAQSGLRSTGYSSSTQSRVLPSELARLLSSARNSRSASPQRTSDFSVEAAPSPHAASFTHRPRPPSQNECSYVPCALGYPRTQSNGV